MSYRTSCFSFFLILVFQNFALGQCYVLDEQAGCIGGVSGSCVQNSCVKWYRVPGTEIWITTPLENAETKVDCETPNTVQFGPFANPLPIASPLTVNGTGYSDKQVLGTVVCTWGTNCWCSNLESFIGSRCGIDGDQYVLADVVTSQPDPASPPCVVTIEMIDP